ncbi:MAG: hypothetical protein SGJ20_12145 [Planctomycetota bacterium]|nr:hypothetical protein [Planctomycetota bacterium]
MQSTITMAFRAVVLLACLIIFPLLAIFGKELPEVARKFIVSLVEKSQSVSAPLAPATTSSGTSAPDFGPNMFRPAPASAAPEAATSAADPNEIQPLAALGQAAPPADLLPPGARSAPAGDPAGSSPFPARGEFPGQPGEAPSGNFPASHTASGPPSNLGQPANYEEPAPGTAGQSAPLTANIPANPAADQQIGGDHRFRDAQARLRQLGASYYLLETWGESAETYRFFCKVTPNGDRERMWAFYHTDPDPVVAMNNVIQQIETWYSQNSIGR